MDKRVVWGVVILVAAVIVFFFFRGGSSSTANYDSFAKCLKSSGAVMYGAYWCPHCNDQKSLFKGSKDLIPYVECSLPNAAGQTPECTAAGIKAYPTWKFSDGKSFEGSLPLETLSQYTGCPLS